MGFPDGNKLFAGNLRANLDEANANMGSIYKEMELEVDCLTSRTLLQNVCSYKCQFCSKVCASSRLVSQVYVIAG